MRCNIMGTLAKCLNYWSPFPSSSPAGLKCCLLLQVDYRRISVKQISTIKILAEAKFVSGSHHYITKSVFKCNQNNSDQNKNWHLLCRYRRNISSIMHSRANLPHFSHNNNSFRYCNLSDLLTPGIDKSWTSLFRPERSLTNLFRTILTSEEWRN